MLTFYLYVYIHICLHKYVYIYIYIFLYIYLSIYIYIHLNQCIYTYLLVGHFWVADPRNLGGEPIHQHMLSQKQPTPNKVPVGWNFIRAWFLSAAAQVLDMGLTLKRHDTDVAAPGLDFTQQSPPARAASLPMLHSKRLGSHGFSSNKMAGRDFFPYKCPIIGK